MTTTAPTMLFNSEYTVVEVTMVSKKQSPWIRLIPPVLRPKPELELYQYLVDICPALSFKLSVGATILIQSKDKEMLVAKVVDRAWNMLRLRTQPTPDHWQMTNFNNANYLYYGIID